MANLDNSTAPFKANLTGVKLLSGDSTPETLLLALLQGSTITWNEVGRTAVEARDRGRHQSTPCIEETDDGDITGSLVLEVTSWKGSSNVHPYEAMTHTGNAAAWKNTANGGAVTLEMQVSMNSTVDGGGLQTATFKYVRFTDIAVGEQEKLHTITANFTAYENRPIWA